MISYLIFFLVVSVIFVIATLGLNLQWGFAGLFNAGVVAFMAIGGYTFAILVGAPRGEGIGGFGLPFAMALPCAMVASAVASLVIGWATMRLREDFLAIATFGIAVTMQLVANNADALTGGSLGLHGLPRPFGDAFHDSTSYNAFYLLIVAVIAACAYVLLQAIVDSPWGTSLRAIRDDEAAAESLGKPVARRRLEAFMLGASLMGLAGALYAGFISYISPADFQPLITFQIWAMLIIGGSGSNRGAVLGAIVVWGLWTLSGTAINSLFGSQIATMAGALQSILIGLVLVLMLMFRPQGLLGAAPAAKAKS
jgi:branched-chain amino acid transport system permease protein